MPSNPENQGKSVSDRPAQIYDFVDDARAGPDRLRDFSVLFREGREVTVRGHELALLDDKSNGSIASYAIVRNEAGRQINVAVFPVTDLNGIFEKIIMPTAA